LFFAARVPLEAEILVLRQQVFVLNRKTRNPRRCQRITVSGLTTVIEFRIEGSSRYRQPKFSRSVFLSRTRVRELRLSTITR
jgi:hypothetical protein